MLERGKRALVPASFPGPLLKLGLDSDDSGQMACNRILQYLQTLNSTPFGRLLFRTLGLNFYRMFNQAAFLLQDVSLDSQVQLCPRD